MFAGNLVAVQGRARDAAEIGIGLNRSDVADVVTAIALEEEYFVFRRVWCGEHGAPVGGEEFRWGRAVADQVCVGISKIKIDLEFVARHRNVTVKPGQLRFGFVAPAAVVLAIGGDVSRKILVGPARLHFRAPALPVATVSFCLHALEAEAVMHVDGDRTAQCIEAEGGIVVDQIHATDGGLGDQVPLHCVSESLVNADTVLKHCDALGFTEQG